MRRPGKQRETQVDQSGVQSEGCFFQDKAQLFAFVQNTCFGDEQLSEVSIDAPVTLFIGMSERITRDARAPESHVIQTRFHCPQTRFDIAQTFAISQLSKSQREELIQATEGLDFVVTLV